MLQTSKTTSRLVGLQSHPQRFPLFHLLLFVVSIATAFGAQEAIQSPHSAFRPALRSFHSRPCDVLHAHLNSETVPSIFCLWADISVRRVGSDRKKEASRVETCTPHRIIDAMCRSSSVTASGISGSRAPAPSSNRRWMQVSRTSLFHPLWHFELYLLCRSLFAPTLTPHSYLPTYLALAAGLMLAVHSFMGLWPHGSSSHRYSLNCARVHLAIDFALQAAGGYL